MNTRFITKDSEFLGYLAQAQKMVYPSWATKMESQGAFWLLQCEAEIDNVINSLESYKGFDDEMYGLIKQAIRELHILKVSL